MTKQHLYFIGLEHPTLVGLAQTAKRLGFAVSGAGQDIPDIHLQQIQQAGIHIHLQYQAAHVPADSIIVIAPHIPKTNPELIRAQKQDLEIVSQSQLIQQLSVNQYRIAVINSTTAAVNLAAALATSDAAADIISSQLINPSNQWPAVSAVYFSQQARLVIDSSLHPASSLDKAAQLLYCTPRLLLVMPGPVLSKADLAIYEHVFADMRAADASASVIVSDQQPQLASLAKQKKLVVIQYGTSKEADWHISDADALGAPGSVLMEEQLAIQVAEHLGQDRRIAVDQIAQANGLYNQFRHVNAPADYVMLTDSVSPASSIVPFFQKLVQQYKLDSSEQKLWLAIDSQRAQQLASLSAKARQQLLGLIDVLIELEHPSLSWLPKTKLKVLHYQLESAEAAHFIAQNSSPSDIIVSLSGRWQDPLIDQLISQLSARKSRP